MWLRNEDGKFNALTKSGGQVRRRSENLNALDLAKKDRVQNEAYLKSIDDTLFPR